MSPEQACGGPVANATHVWAFGCVLFEMLSGAKAFQGVTSAEIRAAVVRGEPRWDALPAGASAMLASLAKSCLERSPKDRLRHMGDARVLLDVALSAESSSAVTRRPSRRPFRWQPVVIGFGLMSIGALAALGGARLRRQTEPPLMHITMAPPFQLEPSLGFGPSLAISPDGSAIVYVLETGTTTALYLKKLDEIDARAIGGTQGARNPFFSPDSQWIGFYDEDDGHLKKVAVSGGEPASITDVDFEGGAAWSADGTILFAAVDGLMKVSAAGGVPVRVTQAGARQQLWPMFLPGGRVALFTRLQARGTFDEADIVAIQLQNPGEAKVILKAAVPPPLRAVGSLGLRAGRRHSRGAVRRDPPSSHRPCGHTDQGRLDSARGLDTLTLRSPTPGRSSTSPVAGTRLGPRSSRWTRQARSARSTTTGGCTGCPASRRMANKWR